MPQSINSFSGGIQRDLSKQLIPKNQYTNLENFRLITSGGYSNGAIENIKGMVDSALYQDTTPVYKITIDYNYLRSNSPQNVSITINGTTISTIISISTTYEDLYNTLLPLNILADISFSNNQLLLTYPGKVGIGNDIIVVLTGNGILLSTLVPVQTKIHPIGYSQIRDDIYIFSTAAVNINPTNDGINDNFGQIWKLTYNKLTLATTLELLYNNKTNFSLSHPIPTDNASTGRYENSLIQKIYWTDNYNTPRVFNTANPQSFAVDLEILDIQPLITGSIPILSEILASGPDLIGAIYQSCYRLKNTGGGETDYSPLSNLVTLLGNIEDTTGSRGRWVDYVGDDPNTIVNKAIKWKINNLDTDYERIEFIVIQRTQLSDVPTKIVRIFDEPIPLTGEIEFLVTTLTGGIDITLTELNGFNYTFSTAKTISTKDNRLFLANITSKRVDIDYDSRAYRFNGSTLILNQKSTVLYDSLGVATTYNATYDPILGTYSIPVPEQSDAICPNTYLDNDSKYNDNYKYKLNPSSGTQILGGTGENISYEFGTYCIKGDSTEEFPNIGSNEESPFRLTMPRWTTPKFATGSSSINLGISNQDYDEKGTDDGMKFVYRSSLLKGYQRNEVYPFAIQFYDKQMRPTYAKWIGDIKMPDYWDTNNNPDIIASNTGINDFRTSFMGNSSTGEAGSDDSWLQILYIDFQIKIPDSLLNKIGAFDIVRCERTDADKRILDNGYIVPTRLNTGTDYYMPKINTFIGFATGDLTPFFNFQGADNLLRGNYSPRAGDQIRITQLGLKTNINTQIFPQAGAVTNTYESWKLYAPSKPASYVQTGNNSRFSSMAYTVSDAAVLANDSSITIGGLTYNNFTHDTNTTSATIGSKTMIVKTTSPIQFPAAVSTSTFMVSYYRPTAIQYGGNSFSQRANRVYISCGQLQVLNSTNVVGANTTFIIHTFNGDIFTNIIDNQRGVGNWGTTHGVPDGSNATITRPNTGLTLRSFTFYYPTETTINTELRQGDCINRTLFDDDGNNASGYETFTCQPIYANENNIRKYIPKPAEFITVSEFDNRIYFSGVKVNGELRDSWTQFKTDDFYDVEGSYGPINALEILQNNMYFLQDNAFGVLSINPKILIPDSVGGEVQVQSGVGKVITRHDYISTEVGCKHQWGITKSSTTLFWFDINNKKFYRFRGQGAEPLSDIKGLAAYFANNLTGNIITTDNPILSNYIIDNLGNSWELNAGITATYDFRYNEALFTFFDYSYLNPSPSQYTNVNQFKSTIVYNEQIDSFTGFYTHYPKLYINDHISIFSCDPTISTDLNSGTYTNNSLYIHDKGDYGRFYGIINDAKLSFIVNDTPLETKVFDNFQWLSEATDLTTGTAVNVNNETFQTIRCYNDYQNTDFQLLDPLSLSPNIARKERSWNLPSPRNRVLYTASNSPDIFTDLSVGDKPYGERLRDKYLFIDLSYNNLNNYKLVFYDTKTQYRISAR